MPIVIGFAGPAGSGKSLCTSLLVQMFPQGEVEAEYFAKPLKEVCRALGMNHVSLHGTQEEKEAPVSSMGGISGRQFMQRIGTDMFRTHFDHIFPELRGPYNIWANMMKRRITNDMCHKRLVVISDVRFPDEVQMIRDMGGYVYYVTRTCAHASPGAHVSETSLRNEDCDGTIENDRDVCHLEAALRQLIRFHT